MSFNSNSEVSKLEAVPGPQKAGKMMAQHLQKEARRPLFYMFGGSRYILYLVDMPDP